METTTTRYREDVAEEVRALMGRGIDGKRVTQERLGEVLNLSQGPMSRRLSGALAFDLDQLIAIAEFFDVSLASIIQPLDEARREERRSQGKSPTKWYGGSAEEVVYAETAPYAYDVPLFEAAAA